MTDARNDTRNHITHIAIKVMDLEKSLAYYRDVFGYEVITAPWHNGHVSCSLRGAGINLTLLKYDSEESPEALYAGTGATIHHIGIESDDLEATAAKLVAAGCTLLSEPTATPVKYRAPDGTIAEVIPLGSGRKRM
jgi:lactoylglutathione lyase